jgi:small subunit ribosomal protein S8
LYGSSDKLPRVRNGLGTAILSTSRGLMTDRQARREKVGGEYLCSMW